MQDVWWDGAIDGVVEDVLRAGGCVEPPVDAVDLAERLQVRVLEQRQMDVRGKLIRHDGGRDLIVVRREAWEERTQYTIAHELGERYAETVCLRAGEGFDDLSADFIESLAHRFASRLLCPQPWFEADNAIHDGDLFALKDRYETASHEVIAFRLLQLETPSVVTVIDNGRVTRRRANRSGLRTKQLTPAERNTWERCRLTGHDTKTDHGPARIAAWPIWTASVRREIVRMWLVDDEG